MSHDAMAGEHEMNDGTIKMSMRLDPDDFAALTAEIEYRRERCYADALAAKTVAVGCGGEGDNPYSLTLDEVAAPEPVPELDRRSMLAAIRLDKLDVKSRRIVVLRLGLDPDEPGPMTLREIGERLGITRERARQIEKRAMMTLRLHAGEPRPERSVQV